MNDVSSLERLRIALTDIKGASLNSIIQDGRKAIQYLNKISRPNRVHYPTAIHVLAEELLAAEYFQDLIKQDLALDEESSAAAERVVARINGSDKTWISSHHEGSEQILVLTQDSGDLQNVLQTLTALKQAVENCHHSYQGLTKKQRRAIAESMKQSLWPRLAMICADLQTMDTILCQHRHCSVCKADHDSKLCFADQREHVSTYSLRIQIRVHSLWNSIEVEVRTRSTRSQSHNELLSQAWCISNLSHNNSSTICIFRDGPRQEAYLAQGNQRKPSAAGTNMISLREWIKHRTPSDFRNVQKDQRITLATLLAYYYLHLSGSKLWPDDNMVPDVWFESYKVLNTSKPDLRRPFLGSLTASGAQQSSNLITKGFNTERPSLPALGKLLLEIWLARELDWNEVLNERGIPECRGDEFTAQFYASVARCWSTKFIRRSGPLSRNETMQNEYESWVVKGLQRILHIHGIRQNDIFEGNHADFDEINPSDTIGENMVDELELEREQYRNESESQHDPASARDQLLGNDGQSRNIMIEASNGQSSVETCLHEDGSQSQINQDHKAQADTWFADLQALCHPFLKARRGIRKHKELPRVKVAVLDTGAYFDPNVQREFCGNRIMEYRTWCGEGIDLNGKVLVNGEDKDGHGTQSTALVLEVAPQCLVYVAKIFDSRFSNRNSNHPTRVTEQRIADAIKYAVEKWEVDVISMSFGFDQRSEIIETQLDAAAKAGILLLASSSNHGALRRITYPASDQNVIRIHAMTGRGNKFGLTTTGLQASNNFATVGSNVETWSIAKNGEVDGYESIKRHCSGSSVATSVAAGIAACIIELMRSSKEDYLKSYLLEPSPKRWKIQQARYDSCLAALRKKDGMEAVFKLIVGHTGTGEGYSFLAPAIFIHSSESGLSTTKIDNILKVIETRGT